MTSTGKHTTKNKRLNDGWKWSVCKRILRVMRWWKFSKFPPLIVTDLSGCVVLGNLNLVWGALLPIFCFSLSSASVDYVAVRDFFCLTHLSTMVSMKVFMFAVLTLVMSILLLFSPVVESATTPKSSTLRNVRVRRGSGYKMMCSPRYVRRCKSFKFGKMKKKFCIVEIKYYCTALD